MKRATVLVVLLALFPITVTGCFQIENPGASWSWEVGGVIGTGILAVATVALVLWTIFGTKCREWKRRPILEIAFDPKPPGFMKLLMSYAEGDRWSTTEAYWIHFEAVNNGVRPAEQVEAFLAEVRQEDEEGRFKILERFVPLNLIWAYTDNEAVYPRINNGLPRHFDIGHIANPVFLYELGRFDVSENPFPEGVNPYPERFDTLEDLNAFRLSEPAVLSLATVSKPTTRSYMLLDGHYMLKIIVSSANAEVTEKFVDIDFTGQWTEDTVAMWQNEVRVLPVSPKEAAERIRLADQP